MTVSRGTPEGCVLSPLLHTLFSNDRISAQDDITIKFADDTTVFGLPTVREKAAYRKLVARLMSW